MMVNRTTEVHTQTPTPPPFHPVTTAVLLLLVLLVLLVQLGSAACVSGSTTFSFGHIHPLLLLLPIDLDFLTDFLSSPSSLIR